MSLKVVYLTLCTVCLMGLGIVYFVDINMVTSKFVNSRLTYLKFIWSTNKNNLTEEETAITFNDTGSSFHLKTPTTVPLISQVNKSSRNVTTRLFSKVTAMSFNSSLVVQCKESPYIQCTPSNITQPLSNKQFKIVYLRRPSWLTADATSCKINQCVVSDGPVTNDTDLVVVYAVGLPDSFQPPQRWTNQTYIIAVWESPIHTYSDVLKNANSPWNSRINLIMSYRVGGDVFAPYSHLVFSPKPLPERPNYYEIAKNKTRTAVWIVSHCGTQSRREQYVREMQKYIDVDILGGCGTPCKTNSVCDNWGAKYKFYLSFENSLCTDYVTEKFFKLFNQKTHVIPVVRGGADYDKHFPNFTYINSAHFRKPKDLALHLKDLASDLQTYSKYLEYMDLYKEKNVNHNCRLCSFAHTHTLPVTKTYNLKSWINDGHCHNPQDL
ncbi:unnamed protein product [Candidula unifasciata]|uniref:Fucosyltransferase n=1 Tax=Candidula unifasciata TaxID=100452 RepID=A0A8S3ZTM7_9EUPU|nr:unnamed protein product [Candidula unifasciata]